jgi:hypothetical protein
MQKSGYLTLTFPRGSPLASGSENEEENDANSEKTFEVAESSFSFSDESTGTGIEICVHDESYQFVLESVRRVCSKKGDDYSSECFRFNNPGYCSAEVSDRFRDCFPFIQFFYS